MRRVLKSGGVLSGAMALGLACCGTEQEYAEWSATAETESEVAALTAGTVVTFEAENLSRTASAIGSKVTSETAASAGKYVEFNGTAGTGAWIEFTLPNLEAGNYDLSFLFKSNTNRGLIQASVDGANQGSVCNEYASRAAYKVACSIGSKTLTAGNHKIRFTVTGKSTSSSGYQMVVDQIALTAKLGDGPCDIFAAAGTPCVSAYSMVRSLSKNYTGPLYQVRSGSSTTNTGTGGVTKDIGRAADGYADSAAQDAFCANTICTVSVLYDQSGKQNHLKVAKKGLTAGGAYAGLDDYEAVANKGIVTAGGRKVYSLYTSARVGYRTPVGVAGAGVPRGTASQGIYELADGTHVGTACCFDFGNVSTDPMIYHTMNTLFFGTAYWGKGAGTGPWMMADFEAGVWAGGSKPGDPGWGALDSIGPANPTNPSLKVPFALGFLKTNQTNYAIRVADTKTASSITTAYDGALPKTMDNQGGIVLGVASDNSNNSFGTFYEGAVLAGYPSNATELAVMKNIQAVGYTK